MKSGIFFTLLSASLASALCFIPTSGLSAGESCAGVPASSTGCDGLDMYICNGNVWELSAICGNSCFCSGGSATDMENDPRTRNIKRPPFAEVEHWNMEAELPGSYLGQ
ncbi:hypothetical protein GGX14DRAFT_388031 [Mycena pura]|uniref:Uncharacterized protein n=1 Tax=Mycena pura TaxID=153505 RepID=A0AAD6VXI5_9AGAR|nr:hypothetical protein GGX14DRAFT_388031 [Mycena pura]